VKLPRRVLFFLFQFLGIVYRTVHRTLLDAQYTVKRVFGGQYIPSVSFCFEGQPPPIYAPKTAFCEHLQHKPMESVFAYILTTDKAIITKLDRNINQIILHNGVQLGDKKGVA